MIKKIAFAVVALALPLSFTGCDDSSESYTPSNDDGGSGLGMTYGGKPGIDLGGGLVMPFDGSGVGPGYGY